jgi:hypothetical protein
MKPAVPVMMIFIAQLPILADTRFPKLPTAKEKLGPCKKRNFGSQDDSPEDIGNYKKAWRHLISERVEDSTLIFTPDFSTPSETGAASPPSEDIQISTTYV